MSWLLLGLKKLLKHIELLLLPAIGILLRLRGHAILEGLTLVGGAEVRVLTH